MRAMESVFHLKACDFLEQLKTAAATFLTLGTAMTAGLKCMSQSTLKRRVVYSTEFRCS